MLGPYAGNLQDSGEKLELTRPGAPVVDSLGQTTIPQIVVDEVRYNDKPPWPAAADGEGPSLQRLNSGAYGNDPANWFASGISPGAANVFNSAPQISISLPTNGARFTVPASIRITADPTDIDGTILQVELFADGARLGTLTNAPYTFIWTNVGPGNYSLTAKAKDNGFAATVSAPVLVTVNPPPVGNGTGLSADYYDNIDFTGTKITRVDPTVNFDWGSGSPDPRIGADSFSARWTGLVQPRYSGVYAFYTTTDDGVRLWVNNQLIINNWTDHGPTDDVGLISLSAGAPYDIRMDFYENGGGAMAILGWTPPGLAREVIPMSQLYPFTNGFFRITGQPQSTNLLKGKSITFTVAAGGFNPLTYQWYFNETNLIAGATGASFTITNAQSSASGTYRVLVSDGSSTLLSDPATLTVIFPPEVTSPLTPLQFGANEGSTITLRVAADGSLPITYNWRRNFTSFTNMVLFSNACTITITNLQGITNTYTVRLTNSAGEPRLHTNAIVTVLTPPIITNQPASLTLGVGSNAVFRAGVRGTAPLIYQWFKNGVLMPTQTNSLLGFTNIEPANEGVYFALITNSLGSVTTTNAVLFIDSDRDGIPDSWELAHGLNPTNANDASIDSDGDSLSNAQEYIAGTDPQDAQSFLRIDTQFAPTRGAVLSFVAVSNRTYTILYRTNLNTGAWLRLTDLAPSVPTNRNITFTNAPNAEATRVYRLVVPKLP